MSYDDRDDIEARVNAMRSQKHRDELRALTTELVVAMVANGSVEPVDSAALRAAVVQAAEAARVIRVEIREAFQ